MNLCDLFKRPNIDEGVQECRNTAGAVLLDVRSEDEFRGSAIPGSKNLPLDRIGGIESLVAQKDTPIFVYCHSGMRSGMAAANLKKMGYIRVKNIGGIMSYTGKLEP